MAQPTGTAYDHRSCGAHTKPPVIAMDPAREPIADQNVYLKDSVGAGAPSGAAASAPEAVWTCSGRPGWRRQLRDDQRPISCGWAGFRHAPCWLLNSREPQRGVAMSGRAAAAQARALSGTIVAGHLAAFMP